MESSDDEMCALACTVIARRGRKKAIEFIERYGREEEGAAIVTKKRIVRPYTEKFYIIKCGDFLINIHQEYVWVRFDNNTSNYTAVLTVIDI